MNDTVFYIIMILIVVLLFLAYLLIAYFYNSYDTYKITTNDNFTKTKDYINNTTKTLDTNMNTLNINTNNKYGAIIDNIKNENNIKFNMMDSNLLKINSNNLNLQSNITSNTTNLNNFDRNIKQYIEFKDNNNNINEAIFNHAFSAIPNLSLNIIRNITAISGMTIKTDDLNSNQFRICDNDITSKNCIDMSVKNGIFNIKKSDTDINYNNNNNNNVNNLKIKGNRIFGSSSRIGINGVLENNVYYREDDLVNFDLSNNSILFGGDEYNASMYIDAKTNITSHGPYLRELNFFKDGFESFKQYKKESTGINILDKLFKIENYNTIKFTEQDIKVIRNEFINNSILISYTIIKETPPKNNILILNLNLNLNLTLFKFFGIEFEVNINEFSNTENNVIPTIIKENEDININSIILNKKKLLIKINEINNFIYPTEDFSNESLNIRIKLSSDKFTLPDYYKENIITNFTKGKIIINLPNLPN